MRYRQRPREAMVKLDIQDLVAIKEIIEFGSEHERMSTSAYRKRLEAYVLELADNNPVLQKIRDNKEVDASDIHALAKLLEEQSIHPQGIRGVFKPEEINEVIDLASRLAA